MAVNTESFINSNSIFKWIGVSIVALLLIPFIASQFTAEVNWSLSDYMVMASLLAMFSVGFVFIARKISPQKRLASGIGLVLLFVYIWAELAIGIFTNIGN